ncbi:hypothetical protein J6590_031594 [Homalodisca vitripennis]|nr:hypothetical protein J6590_031594 [Homalodisca vitripennis]
MEFGCATPFQTCYWGIDCPCSISTIIVHKVLLTAPQPPLPLSTLCVVGKDLCSPVGQFGSWHPCFCLSPVSSIIQIIVHKVLLTAPQPPLPLSILCVIGKHLCSPVGQFGSWHPCFCLSPVSSIIQIIVHKVLLTAPQPPLPLSTLCVVGKDLCSPVGQFGSWHPCFCLSPVSSIIQIIVHKVLLAAPQPPLPLSTLCVVGKDRCSPVGRFGSWHPCFSLSPVSSIIQIIVHIVLLAAPQSPLPLSTLCVVGKDLCSPVGQFGSWHPCFSLSPVSSIIQIIVHKVLLTAPQPPLPLSTLCVVGKDLCSPVGQFGSWHPCFCLSPVSSIIQIIVHIVLLAAPQPPLPLSTTCVESANVRST